ncbi:hypothetical protein LGK95_19715 [Clostridium algoriphilum]|uniref:hypothetical protein n=1 Tax=Clostridium algoriphilum TaxID=198347 RepID=UPI001CF35171|nr:hypothetical protein [Clostridium algoriphilum]MCB2295707.1 hypothetical protein [Clostridium algoriphilum]
MLFRSLGLFVFFIFIITITKKQMKLPTIGLMLSMAILLTGVSISSFAFASNNTTKVDSNSVGISNPKISKEMGLKIVTSRVVGFHVLYDSKRVINKNIYYLYTLNTDGYTLDDIAYCVNVDSGKLFKCSIDMVLLQIE